jgi:hypothetical protein
MIVSFDGCEQESAVSRIVLEGKEREEEIWIVETDYLSSKHDYGE